MIYRRDKKDNIRNKKKSLGLYIKDVSQIAREKEKARKLRNSSWWRKKCATGLCVYCGQKIPAGELTMDHIIPLSRGGLSEKFNIVLACKECNNKKKYLLPAEWDEYLENIRKK